MAILCMFDTLNTGMNGHTSMLYKNKKKRLVTTNMIIGKHSILLLKGIHGELRTFLVSILLE